MRRVPPIVRTLIIVLVAAATLHGADFPERSPATALILTSEAGDPLGAGATYNFSPESGTFTVTPEGERTVRATYRDVQHTCEMVFMAPSYAPLGPDSHFFGSHRNAPEGVPQASMNFSLDGRSAAVSGEFGVIRYIYAAGGKVAAFFVTFEVQAPGATGLLRGELRYDVYSTEPPVNRAPGLYLPPTRSTGFGTVLPLRVYVGDDGVNPGTPSWGWSKVSGPGEVTFGRYWLEWGTSAEFSAPGEYRLSYFTSDGEYTTTRETVVTVHPGSGDTLLRMSLQQPSDAEPTTREYTGADALFTSEGTRRTVVVQCFGKDGVRYSATFAAADGEPLRPGRHEGATQYGNGGFGPVLRVSAGSTAYGSVGAFDVLDVEFSPEGDLISLHVVFELLGIIPSPMKGELRLHAGTRLTEGNRPPGVSAGFQSTVRLGQPLPLRGVVRDDGPAGNLTTTWSLASGPAPVTFQDPSALQTVASFTRQGEYVVQLSASDGQHTTTSFHTVQVAGRTGPTLLHMVSEPGDWIGLGGTYRYAMPEAIFAASGSPEAIHFRVEQGLDNFSIDLAAPTGKELQVGEYPVRRSHAAARARRRDSQFPETRAGSRAARRVSLFTNWSSQPSVC